MPGKRRNASKRTVETRIANNVFAASKEDIMGLLDRLFNKPIAPSVTKRAVPELSGSMTAHQAWAVVAPLVRGLDRNARLTLITSGLDMNHEGRSRTWEFIFLLPQRNLTVMFSLEPDPQSADVDGSPCILTQRINQASATDATRPAFPDRFRDSPDAVAEFSAQGVDFVSGPSDMKLEGRMLPSNEAVWATFGWDREHTTSFQP